MNKGVEILLSRMDSHPEEFRDWALPVATLNGRPGRWGLALKLALEYKGETHFLEESEREALRVKLHDLRGKLFTDLVLHELTAGPMLNDMPFTSVGQLMPTHSGIDTTWDVNHADSYRRL